MQFVSFGWQRQMGAGGAGASSVQYDPEFNGPLRFNDVAGATGAEPWMSTFLFGTTLTGGSPAGTSAGIRHLPANSDRVVKAHDGFLGDNSKNGGVGVSTDTIATVLAANGHTDVALHKVSDGTIKLRSYLIPDGENEFKWDDSNTPTAEQYAIAGMLNTAREDEWYNTLTDHAPVSVRKRFNLWGRGYLNTSWLWAYPEDTVEDTDEIDIMEAAIDDSNLSAGFFFLYSCKGPNAAAGVFEIVPGLFGEWHVFDMEIEGGDIVLSRNGLERYRTDNAADYVDRKWYFKETIEGGGASSLPGLFLGDDSPRGQPGTITTGNTPNPTEVEIDYIRRQATLIRPAPASSTRVILDASTEYLSAANNAAINFAGDFSVLFHMKLNMGTYAESTYPVIFQKMAASVGYTLQLGAFADTIFSDIGDGTRYQATDNLSSWEMLSRVARTYGVGREGSNVYLFINGCRFGPYAATGADLTNSNPLYIGNYGNGADAAGFVALELYHGAAYSRLLTAEEAWLFAGTVPTTGRTAYWPVNEGSGATIADADGSADITISGASWAS